MSAFLFPGGIEDVRVLLYTIIISNLSTIVDAGTGESNEKIKQREIERCFETKQRMIKDEKG